MSVTGSGAEEKFGIPVFFKEQKIHFLNHIKEHLKYSLISFESLKPTV